MKSNTIITLIVIVFLVAGYIYLNGFAAMMANVHF